MALVLYQFPISHFCEKARWALDYKGLDYTTKNLLPGLHVKTTKKLAARSSVPGTFAGDPVASSRYPRLDLATAGSSGSSGERVGLALR